MDAIELTSLYDLTALSREEMMFDKEKLLSVFDETVKAGTDPIRTHRGDLGPASEPAPVGAQPARSTGDHIAQPPAEKPAATPTANPNA